MTDSLPEDLTLAQIQAVVDAWIAQSDAGYWSPLANLARLTEEVGELAREINHVHGAKPKKATEPPARIGEELADILFVVVTLANSLDINLTEEFKGVMEKYRLRDTDRFPA
ncbi:MAG: nucleotide pyrophosphohydrolase [Bradymonadaceae bacterium]